jgi:uncharacterized protein (DUF58 family)
MSADRRSDLTPIAMRSVTSAAWVIAGICALMALAARTTGSGWLVVIMCMLAGALAIGLVTPHVALIGVGATATGPSDTVAGAPTTLAIAIGRPNLGYLVRIDDGPWTMVTTGGPVMVTMVPPRRGRYDSVDIELCCGAPFGLSWARRRLRVPLVHDLLAAPRTVDDATQVPPASDVGESDEHSTRPHGGEQLRSVRDYVHGDPLRLVHWPATARRGELVVKELETPARRHVHITVELRGGANADERVCERAMGIVTRALGDGHTVTLATASPDGPQLGDIGSRVDAGRQLAVAVAGHCPVPTTIAGTAQIHLRSGGE